MASLQLDRLVRVFSVLLPAVGCAEREVVDDGSIDEAAFDLRLCEGGELDVMSGLSPVEPTAYTELRDAWLSMGGGDPLGMPSALDAAGERCADATDVDICTQAFDALPFKSQIVVPELEGTERHRTVVLTRGNAAEALTSVAAIRDFLGPIDAAHDAGLIALAEGYELVCDRDDNAAEADDGWIVFATSGQCDVYAHVLHVSREGELDIVESGLIRRADPSCGAVGRLPAGLCRRARPTRGGAVGRFFAEVAELEASAVAAFGQLADELAVHRAPRPLLRDALRSRRDEIRHARVTARLARRYGTRPTMPRVRPIAPRSLVEVAADNAAEGCVRETFGALVATLQARRAADPFVRNAMRSIAIDETRHAALSWEIAAWADARLSPAERRRVAAHTRQATERFVASVEYAEAVHRVTGMPRPDEAHALFTALQRALA
jgi:hypothetical protein